jgi:hypothetical protein
MAFITAAAAVLALQLGTPAVQNICPKWFRCVKGLAVTVMISMFTVAVTRTVSSRRNIKPLGKATATMSRVGATEKSTGGPITKNAGGPTTANIERTPEIIGHLLERG